MRQAVFAGLCLFLAVGSAHAQEPLSEFQDCPDCPVMVVLPPGSFTMGAGAAEQAFVGRVPPAQYWAAVSSPTVDVTIAYTLAIGKFELTIAQYAVFAAETGRQPDGPCYIRFPTRGPYSGEFEGEVVPFEYNMVEMGAALVQGADVQNPGRELPDDHPASCLSRGDVDAYLAWLSEKTGRKYRQPTNAEWEYAARAGTASVFYWGDSENDACEHANFADRDSGYTAYQVAPCAEANEAYTTMPVGSYKPNAWGLHDMIGNVAEPVEDCYTTDYVGAPTDGSPWLERADDNPHDGWIDGVCATHQGRGMQFESIYVDLASALTNPDVRSLGGERGRVNWGGLRVAVSLSGPAWDLK